MIDKDLLIQKLGLSPHPEGGYYRRTYQSTDNMPLPERFSNEASSCATAIYYLLSGNEFSAWHKIQSDEMWHHYVGSSIRLLTIDPASKMLNEHILGSPVDDGALPQITVPYGHWFCAELVDKSNYALEVTH